MKKTLIVSVSGGRTSEYMSKWLIDNKSDEFNLVHVFMNTGQEHEKTLEFVDKCDKEFGQSLIWIEAVVHHGKRKSSSFKRVRFETASRKGEPFEQVIEKYGIPNMDFPHCNRELKLNPFKSLLKELKINDELRAVGIRVDEIDRMAKNHKKDKIIYPLIKMNPKTKIEIIDWWSKQSFNLEIPEHLGNCVTCWKKSKRKLLTIAKNEPERFDFFGRMEIEKGMNGAVTKDENGNELRRVFFRGHKESLDIINDATKPFNEFIDTNMEYDSDMDGSNGCTESCDVFADG